MEILRILSGPVIGAVIGYFTNYIAVKMLFRPKNPIMIGSYQLPFTPGIIPKRKADLGKAVGHAVQNELFGASDIKGILLADETKKVMINGITDGVMNLVNGEHDIKHLAEDLVGEDQYDEKKEELTGALTDKIVNAIMEMDIGKIITDKGTDFIMTQFNNPLLTMFITPELISSIAGGIGDQVNKYLEDEGHEKIFDYTAEQIDELEQKKPADLLGDTEKLKLLLQEKTADFYQNFVESHADEIVSQFKIQEIIETRIAQMSNESLEELVLSVMKHELGMIVNLGAVIGAVIGIINIFI